MANFVGYENVFSEGEDQSQNKWLSALSCLLKPSASCRHCAFPYHVDGRWNDAGEKCALWWYRWVNALAARKLYFYTKTHCHHHHHQHGAITRMKNWTQGALTGQGFSWFCMTNSETGQKRVDEDKKCGCWCGVGVCPQASEELVSVFKMSSTALWNLTAQLHVYFIWLY